MADEGWWRWGTDAGIALLAAIPGWGAYFAHKRRRTQSEANERASIFNKLAELNRNLEEYNGVLRAHIIDDNLVTRQQRDLQRDNERIFLRRDDFREDMRKVTDSIDALTNRLDRFLEGGRHEDTRRR